MSQGEFGRALGWAPSTISRWESGRGQPSRLDLKIILAFGEERGVRYRPRPPAPATVPAIYTGTGPQPAVEVLPCVSAPQPPRPVWAPTTGSQRPRWEAELRLRVKLADRQRGDGLGSHRLRHAAIAGASLCALLAIGVPLTREHPTAAAPIVVARRQHVRSEHRPHLRAVRRTPAPVPAPVVTAAAPRLARLEGVTLLGTMRQATFRAGSQTLTLSEGDQLSGQRTTHIGGDGVELADATGNRHTVKLGDQVRLE